MYATNSIMIILTQIKKRTVSLAYLHRKSVPLAVGDRNSPGLRIFLVVEILDCLTFFSSVIFNILLIMKENTHVAPPFLILQQNNNQYMILVTKMNM